MDNFEKWFNKVNEELAVSPTVNTEVATEVSVETDSNIDRNDMIGDIDNIMTSLETLASELTEELSVELNESAGDMVKMFITGFKASSAQAKVNKIKMNVADLEFAADRFDGDKQEALRIKADKVKEQAERLQELVDDRFSGQGDYVGSRLHKAKIEGQLQIIKRTSGMEDNPSKKSDLKTKLVELTKKYNDESRAIKELENNSKESLKQAKQDAGGVKESTTEKELSNMSPQESLIYRATEASLLELASEISEKAAWQLDNTTLYTKYDTIIKKTGYDSIIAESSSIKDNFNTLLNS